VRAIEVPAHAGTAFDGEHLFQIAEDRIQKIDPTSGRVLATIPTPAGRQLGTCVGRRTLWVGQYRNRKIHQIDPQTGAVLRTIESNRFVTGVTWVDRRALARHLGGRRKRGAAGRSAIRQVLERLEMPPGWPYRGLESDGGDGSFAAAAAAAGAVVRRPKGARVG